jgi:long-chain acyl-CoA synthetase
VALKFTSGSTGAAKAIAATWGSIGMSLSAVEEMFDHGPGDTLFVFLTLSLLQQRYWVYTALLRGTDLVIATPQTALFALRAAQPSVIMGVPAFFETLKTLIETRGGRGGVHAPRGGEIRDRRARPLHVDRLGADPARAPGLAGGRGRPARVRGATA